MPPVEHEKSKLGTVSVLDKDTGIQVLTHAFDGLQIWLSSEIGGSLDSCDLFTHIVQGYSTGTGAILWLPQCQWSNLEQYG